jgi:hypothetical protein
LDKENAPYKDSLSPKYGVNEYMTQLDGTSHDEAGVSMRSSPGNYRQRGNPSKRGTEIADPNNPDMSDKEQPMRGAAK